MYHPPPSTSHVTTPSRLHSGHSSSAPSTSTPPRTPHTSPLNHSRPPLDRTPPRPRTQTTSPTPSTLPRHRPCAPAPPLHPPPPTTPHARLLTPTSRIDFSPPATTLTPAFPAITFPFYRTHLNPVRPNPPPLPPRTLPFLPAHHPPAVTRAPPPNNTISPKYTLTTEDQRRTLPLPARHTTAPPTP